MIQLNVKLDGFTKIDFERRKVMAVLKTEGRLIRNKAKQLISNRQTSQPGGFIGKKTGLTQKSLSVFASRRDLAVVVAPRRFKKQKSQQVGIFASRDYAKTRKDKRFGKKTAGSFFPTILIYGTKTINPRKDYIEYAFSSQAAQAKDAIYNALIDSLKFR